MHASGARSVRIAKGLMVAKSSVGTSPPILPSFYCVNLQDYWYDAVLSGILVCGIVGGGAVMAGFLPTEDVCFVKMV